ncbi:MAG: hypothetical protein NVSMB42_18440 [Herpetosiphon sp.]
MDNPPEQPTTRTAGRLGLRRLRRGAVFGRVGQWGRQLLVPLTLAPALGLIALLFGTSVVYGVAQSLGYLPFLGQTTLTLNAYRTITGGATTAHDFWVSFGFSLWVCCTATLLASVCALLVVMLYGARLRVGARGLSILNINLSFPHLVWAIGLSLLLSQSGLLARAATGLRLIRVPADFPVLIRDHYGIGIILDYLTKETPFLVLILLSILRSQPDALAIVAENLGATRFQRMRYVTLPLILPGLSAGAMLVFAYVFGAYEVPAVLGVQYPRMLSVLALEFFANPDLHSRAEGMAVSVVMALVVVAAALLSRALSNRQTA